MIRDIADRIREFGGEYDFEIVPIALTWEQIETHNPPPNPAKLTDPRAKEYIAKHGLTSWEVDALPPEVLHNILDNTISENLDSFNFEAMLKIEAEHRHRLESLKLQL